MILVAMIQRSDHTVLVYDIVDGRMLNLNGFVDENKLPLENDQIGFGIFKVSDGDPSLSMILSTKPVKAESRETINVDKMNNDEVVSIMKLMYIEVRDEVDPEFAIRSRPKTLH